MAANQRVDPEHVKNDQREEWKAAARGWRKWDAKIVAWTAPVTAALVAVAEIRPGMQVLDIGSGTGEPALTLAGVVGPTGHVTATDLSPEMLAVAEDKAREQGATNVSFEVADAEQL